MPIRAALLCEESLPSLSLVPPAEAGPNIKVSAETLA